MGRRDRSSDSPDDPKLIGIVFTSIPGGANRTAGLRRWRGDDSEVTTSRPYSATNSEVAGAERISSPYSRGQSMLYQDNLKCIIVMNRAVQVDLLESVVPEASLR